MMWSQHSREKLTKNLIESIRADRRFMSVLAQAIAFLTELQQALTRHEQQEGKVVRPIRVQPQLTSQHVAPGPPSSDRG
jgi:hypothetical protein